MKMKFVALALTMAAPMAAQAAQYSTYADSPGVAVGFAEEVVTYNPGPGAFGVGANQPDVLGEPNGTSLSLGKKGDVTLKIGPNALKADGSSMIDLYVYEAGWWDSFDVYLSANGTTFTKLTPTTNARAARNTGSWVGFNIDGQVDSLLSYPYVKIVDTSNSTSTVPGTDGADIDGIMITSAASPVGNYVMHDTDMLGGNTYNLYQDGDTGAVGVKVITTQGAVAYIPFSDDDTLEPIALSVQSDVNNDGTNDLNVLVSRKADNAQLNIYRSLDGTLIRTIDNSAVK